MPLPYSALIEDFSSFLAGLRDGHFQTGTFPTGVLIDNRFGDTNLSAVQEFCREHRIVIVRTFPRSSKTNGNIENNFSIFKRFVGPVEVQGDNPQELATSVAAVIIEIFTQLRNHTPRGRLRGGSPANASTGAVRPALVRPAIENLSKRLLREERDGALKWTLISQA